MAACGQPGQDAALFDAVHALAKEICPALSLSIPVGKDSLSMRTVWSDDRGSHSVVSPVSLNLTAVAPVTDVRKTWTPVLARDQGDTVLMLIDLGQGKSRLAGSVLAQVLNQYGDLTPDVETPDLLKAFGSAMQALHGSDLVLSYHDRSDGGLFATLCEMAFASRTGLTINIDLLTIDPVASDWGDFKIRADQVAVQRDELSLKALFNEELGAVIQVPRSARTDVMDILRQFDLSRITYEIGTLNPRDQIEIDRDAVCMYQQPRTQLQRLWSSVSDEVARRRDAPDMVEQEYSGFSAVNEPIVRLPEGFPKSMSVPSLASRPKVAILREQGVNGQVEMAAAFDRAGFEAWDVHMSDLLEGRVQLADFAGLVACGGFSFGDVLGAGRGWARSILFHETLRQQFEAFFADSTRFALGVCNGCQMFSALKKIIPGAQDWPTFEKNRSEQFEARFSQVEVLDSSSIFLSGFAGAILPVVVSHGEGRAVFENAQAAERVTTAMRYVDAQGRPTEQYPANPNGSVQGVTGFTNHDGRITLMMPHPERVFRAVQMSWQPSGLAMSGDASPWLQMFMNARRWVKSA